MTSAIHNEVFLHRFLKFAENYPNAIAINDIDNDRQLSYKQLNDLAKKKKNDLLSIGVKENSKVALILPNGLDFIACYLALISIRALPIIINNKLNSFEVSQIFNVLRPRFIITNQDFYDDKIEILSQKIYSYLIVLCNSNDEFYFKEDDLDLNIKTKFSENLSAPDGNPIVSLQFTWRGTGRPFPVAHRYLEMTYSTDGLHENFYKQGVGSVHLVTLPLYAIFGLSVMLIYPLSIGATLLITNTLLKRDLADVLSTYQVSFACLVPDVIRYFNAQLMKRKQNITGLNSKLMIYSGGGHLPANDAEKLSSLLGCGPVLQGYGLTESLPIVVQNTLGKKYRGAMGQVIRGAEVRIINANGDDVPKGSIGELIVRGSMVVKDYYEDDEGTSLFFRDGWFHTGDLVWSNNEDHLFFVCQRLRISKIRAQMIDLCDIEFAALRHPLVKKARAWIVPDKNEANSIFLSVKVTDENITSRELTSFMGKYLSNFKLPRKIQVLRASEPECQNAS